MQNFVFFVIGGDGVVWCVCVGGVIVGEYGAVFSPAERTRWISPAVTENKRGKAVKCRYQL